VKEIEEALLRGEADLAVHSSKDMPVSPPEGLVIAGVLPREDPRDALILPRSATRESAADADTGALSLDQVLGILRDTPRIGTGSIRRVAQLAQLFPAATFADVRGNLDTRLRKLDTGEFGALVLAAAGLIRLGWSARISARLPVDLCVPAPGQGIVAMECRAGDHATLDAIAAINDSRSHALLRAEWAVVETLGGGCQMPIGVIASEDGGRVTINAMVAAADGSRIVRGRAAGTAADVERLGSDLGRRLLADGADDVLRAIREPHDARQPAKTEE